MGWALMGRGWTNKGKGKGTVEQITLVLQSAVADCSDKQSTRQGGRAEVAQEIRSHVAPQVWLEVLPLRAE